MALTDTCFAVLSGILCKRGKAAFGQKRTVYACCRKAVAGSFGTAIGIELKDSGEGPEIGMVPFTLKQP